MLIPLIIAIALLVFSLLLMAGLPVEQALYRSMLAFLLLFAGLYTSVFLINIIREISHKHPSPASDESSTVDQRNSRAKKQNMR